MSLKHFAAALALGSALLISRPLSAAPEKDAPAKTAEAKGDAKAETKAGDAKSTVKLVKPWSDLASLTEEQKTKIEAIHKKVLAETSAITKKEREDITALLTDAQKAELKELTSTKKKETAATKKPAEGAPAKPEAK
jgi:Spy/CpxP family protein refolding chaperone